MTRDAETQGASIVLLGSFNPPIFHPQWLSSNDLIRPSEAEHAKLEVIHREVAKFQLEWCDIEVLAERFVIASTREPYEVIRDLTVGIFDILSHTPLWAMGINFDWHFRMPSKDAWNALGHVLVSKAPWDDLLKEPGTQSLVVRGMRPDAHTGYIDVNVEPSSKVEFGVYIKVNDHFQVPKKEGQGATEILDLLKEQYATSKTRALGIAEKILELQ